jgi:DUF4097 and DUF4098 domain-containing protein YvlB
MLSDSVRCDAVIISILEHLPYTLRIQDVHRISFQERYMKTFLAFATLILLSHTAFADEWTHHWSVSGKPELHVSAGDAAVVVEVGSDNAIDATITTIGYVIGGSGVTVSEHQSGNSVQIDVKVPNLHFSFGNHSVKVSVRVPREVIGDLHTGDGSIVLRGLHGSLRADTGDGSIRAEDLDGILEAHTGDGSVHARGRFDKLQLHTNDGSVEVEAREGSRLQSDWRIQTGDGSVHLSVPRGLAADLEAHTGDGHIHSDVPMTVNGTQNEHTVQGKLNGGGPLLLVRTGDGSITLSAI